MILLTNLKEVKVNGKQYNPKPILKLTTTNTNLLSAEDREILRKLKQESEANGFKVLLNHNFL